MYTLGHGVFSSTLLATSMTNWDYWSLIIIPIFFPEPFRVCFRVAFEESYTLLKDIYKKIFCLKNWLLPRFCNVLSSTRAVASMLAWFIVSPHVLLIVHIQCKIYTYKWATISRYSHCMGWWSPYALFITWIMILECWWGKHLSIDLGSSISVSM